jgi:hypothetical protein
VKGIEEARKEVRDLYEIKNISEDLTQFKDLPRLLPLGLNEK